MSFFGSLVRNVFVGSRRTSQSRREKTRASRLAAAELLEPRIVLAANFWIAAESGDWNDDANWSDGTPTSDDDVFINALGSTYTVTLEGRADVASLTIDSADATLSLEGERNIFGGTDAPRLNIATDLVNQGAIIIGADGDFGGTINVDGQFDNSGTLESASGTKTLRLEANILNTGNMSLATPTDLFSIGGGIENQGSFEIAASGSLRTFGSGGEFIQADGVLDLIGSAEFNDMLFAFEGGTINGTIPLEDSMLRLSSPNAADFLLRGTTELEGDISANQTLNAVGRTDIFGNIISPRIDHTGDLVNDGTISFEASGSPNGGTIDLRGGTLINTGTLHFPTDSFVNTHRIFGALNNSGTAIFEADVVIDGNALTHANSGTFIVNSRQVEFDLTVTNSGSSLTNTGQIQLNGEGVLKVSRGILNQEADGEITGDGTLEFLFGTLNYNDPDPLDISVFFTGTSGGSNTLNINSSGNAEFTFDDTSVDISGNIATGQTIRLLNSLMFSTDPTFANFGTLRLEDGPNSTRTTQLRTRTGGILTNFGTLEVTAGESLVEIDPSLFNNGTVRFARDTRFFSASATSNRGDFVIENGARVTFFRNDFQFTQESGVLDVQGSLEFSDDEFRFDGGRILGVPTLIDSRLSLNTPVIAEFDLRGTTDLLTDVAASHTLNLLVDDAIGNTLRSATGFTNNGVINVGGSNSRAGFVHILSGSLVNSETGVINFLDNTTREHRIDGNVVNAGEINIDQQLRIFKGGTTHRNAGTININDATLFVTAGDFLNEETGVLAGNGTYEFIGSTTFEDQGVIAPGFSPGAVSLVTENEPTIRETATYQIELGGTTPGTGFDQIQFSSDVVLTGTLQVSLLDGFVPELGTRFEIMTATAFSGAFSAVQLPDFLQVDLSDPTKVVLEVVEPVHNLDVGTISVPTEVVINDPFTVEYTVTNNGIATTQGGWRDSVFLSLDEFFDPAEDLLLGRVNHVGDLAHGASYTETLTVAPPFILPGKYFVIVVTDSLREVPDSNTANNIGVSTEQICLEYETLPFDERVLKGLAPGGRVRVQIPPFLNGDGNGDGDDDEVDNRKRFKLKIFGLPSGAEARVSTSPDGKNDEGFIITPDPADSTLRSVSLRANQTYYVSVTADLNAVDVADIEILAECIKVDVENVELVEFTPARTTIQITGFGLEADFDFCLEDVFNGNEVCGDVQVVNATTYLATFNNLPPSLYNFYLQDISGLQPFECDSCIDTRNVNPATFDVSLNLQSPLGVGRNQPLTINVENTGSVPTQSKIIFLDADNGGQINGTDTPFPILFPPVPAGDEVKVTVEFVGTTGGTVNVNVSEASPDAALAEFLNSRGSFVSQDDLAKFFSGLFPDRSNLIPNASADVGQIRIETFGDLLGANLNFAGNTTDGYTLNNVVPPGIDMPPLVPDGNGNFVLDFSSRGINVQFIYDANGREVGIIVNGQFGFPIFNKVAGVLEVFEGFKFPSKVDFNNILVELGVVTVPPAAIAQITENLSNGAGATTSTLTSAFVEAQDYFDECTACLGGSSSPNVQNTQAPEFSSQSVFDLFRFVANNAGGFGQTEKPQQTGALGKGIADITKFSATSFGSNQVGSKVRVEVEIFGQRHVFEGTVSNVTDLLSNVSNLDPNSNVVPGDGFSTSNPSVVIPGGESGSNFTVQFNSSGQLVSISNITNATQNNPGGTILNAKYDSQGRLVGFDRIDQDGNGNIVNQQDNFIAYQYNDDGKLAKVIALDGRMIEFTYDNGMLSQVTTAEGTTSFLFNPDCTLAQVTNPDGSVQKFSYTTGKLLRQVNDGIDQPLALFDYSFIGKVIVTSPNETFTVSRNENGKATEIENEDGTRTTDPEEIKKKIKDTAGGGIVFRQNDAPSPTDKAISEALTEMSEMLNPNNAAETKSSDGLSEGIDNSTLQRFMASSPTFSLLDFAFQLLNSRDPNEIVGPDGFGPEGFIVKDRVLPYTIHFENDSEATAPAQEVFVTQQLDADLDLATFEFGSFGFGDQVFEVTPGQQEFQTQIDLTATFGILLDVEGNLDQSTGIVDWAFRSIDPATGDLPSNPLFGFLPPNLTSPEGQGFVNYRVQTKSTVGSGTRIDAEASIVFDVNDAIITPAILNTIDNGVPTSQVDALPSVVDSAEFTVSWSGEDDAGGSGIATFDIFVSENGGDFTLLLDDTTATSTQFTGTDGSTYAFFSVATDNVGFEELSTGLADTFTTIQLNQPPIAEDDFFTMLEDETLSDSVAGNDSDPNNDDLQFTQTSNVQHGVLVFADDGTFAYTPDANFNGSDSFTYSVSDGRGESATATVNITITPVNDAPTADDDSATSPEDAAITVDVLGNDFDVEGDPLTVTITNGPQNGSAQVNGDGTITYTPNENFFGNDSLNYTVSDGNGGTATATLSIVISPENDAPIANNDFAATPQGTAITVDVLDNDSDVDGDFLAVTILEAPSNGTAEVNPDGTLTYSPNDDFVGTDEIVYTADDGNGGTAIATLTITVTANELDPGVQLENNVLTIIGTPDNDWIQVFRFANRVVVINNFLDDRFLMFDHRDVQEIVIFAGAGNDLVLLGSRSLPAANIDGGDGNDLLIGSSADDLIRGGNGNDLLIGQKGDDILLGGAGDDLIIGGKGNDILIGNQGYDRLIGGKGRDLFIGDDTSLDDNDEQLEELRERWTQRGSKQQRLEDILDLELTIQDDNLQDVICDVFSSDVDLSEILDGSVSPT